MLNVLEHCPLTHGSASMFIRWLQTPDEIKVLLQAALSLPSCGLPPDRYSHHCLRCAQPQPQSPICYLNPGVLGLVSLRTKRRLFDQVMLVSRMEEEKVIILKEMTQHCQNPRQALDKLDHLLHQTKDDIRNQRDCTAVFQHQYLLEQKLSSVTSINTCIGMDSSFLMMEEDIEEGDEDNEQDGDEHNEQDGDEDGDEDNEQDNEQDF
ncbi:hypothetical protein NQZ68_013783 [Dissostichus eleginoides]|nr:hypothetical protein NQZ68_013783 [Dissostichus eleginoides]